MQGNCSCSVPLIADDYNYWRGGAHRRRSREGPQVRTLTINWLWWSSLAWILTDFFIKIIPCKEKLFSIRSFTLKMHQNRWLRPQPPLCELTVLPDSLAGLRGLLLRRGVRFYIINKRRGGEQEERREEGRGREGLWTLTMLETDWHHWWGLNPPLILHFDHSNGNVDWQWHDCLFVCGRSTSIHCWLLLLLLLLLKFTVNCQFMDTLSICHFWTWNSEEFTWLHERLRALLWRF